MALLCTSPEESLPSALPWRHVQGPETMSGGEAHSAARALPYPHLAQVPVVIVALVLLCDLPAQDDAALPALRANGHSQ